jgi:hypothetical protein
LVEESTSATPAFVPVVLKPEARGSHIEVALASGHVLRVGPGFDVETVRRLVEVIGGGRRR